MSCVSFNVLILHNTWLIVTITTTTTDINGNITTNWICASWKCLRKPSPRRRLWLSQTKHEVRGLGWQSKLISKVTVPILTHILWSHFYLKSCISLDWTQPSLLSLSGLRQCSCAKLGLRHQRPPGVLE